jgi:integrase
MVHHRLKSPRRPETKLVFPAPLVGTLGDPTNVSEDLLQLLNSFGSARPAAGPWSWVTSHTFRVTVATRLDEDGFSPRQVADQLCHANPSMTLDVAVGCQVASVEAARALGR